MRTTHDTDNVQPHRYALLLSALAYGNTRVLSFVLGLFSRDSIRRAIASRCVYACLAASVIAAAASHSSHGILSEYCLILILYLRYAGTWLCLLQ